MPDRRSDPVRVDLPLPPPELSPNARVHWRKRAEKSRRYRRAARWIAMEAQGGTPRNWSRAVARVTFTWPDARRRDADNAIASLKAAFDGLVDAGVVSDDSTAVLRRPEPEHRIDRGHPGVVIEVFSDQAETGT